MSLCVPAETEIGRLSIDADTGNRIRRQSANWCATFSNPTVAPVAGKRQKVAIAPAGSPAGKRSKYITSQTWRSAPSIFSIAHRRSAEPRRVAKEKASKTPAAYRGHRGRKRRTSTIRIRRLGWAHQLRTEEAIAWHRSADTASHDSPALPLTSHAPGFLEARRHAAASEHGTLGWNRAPNIFIFQTRASAISRHRSDVFPAPCSLWGLAQFRITRLPQLWTPADGRKILFFSSLCAPLTIYLYGGLRLERK